MHPLRLLPPVAVAAFIALFLPASPAACQPPSRPVDPALERTVYMLGMTEECLRADDLLRTACGRIASMLPEKNRPLCSLPAAGFRADTARSYPTFKNRHRPPDAESRAWVERLLEKTKKDFELQFQQAYQGRYSSLDLESLHRIVTGQCPGVADMLRRDMEGDFRPR